MRKNILFYLVTLVATFVIVGCSCEKGCSAIELMGAGDRIHDSYTFANTGVSIAETETNTYKISGSVEKLLDENVKDEFNIDDDINYVVAIKLTAINEDVDENNVQISVNGVRSYDAEHLNGSDYTFIIMEVLPGQTSTISVKWNKDAEELTYFILFDENIILK